MKLKKWFEEIVKKFDEISKKIIDVVFKKVGEIKKSKRRFQKFEEILKTFWQRF